MVEQGLRYSTDFFGVPVRFASFEKKLRRCHISRFCSVKSLKQIDERAGLDTNVFI